jgi:hypothetical protein
MEIGKLIEGADTVRYIKAQRIKWLRHFQRMDQTRPTKKLSIGNLWELDQSEDQDSAGKRILMEDLKKAESKKLEGNS